MRIPKIKDLTIRQYIEIEAIKKRFISGDCPEADRACMMLEVATGKSYDYFQSIPLPELFKYTAQLSEAGNLDRFSNTIWVGYRRLNATKELSQMSVAQMTDYMNLIKNNAPINDLLAVMYIPDKYNPGMHAKISKAFLDKKVGDVLGLVFFYPVYLKKCATRIQAYLKESSTFQKNLMNEITTDKGFMDSLTNGGGNTTLINALKTSV